MTENRSARRSDADWDKLVDEWMESGQKQAAFAVARGIRPTTFQKAAWKSRRRRGLSQQPNKSSCHIVEVIPDTQTQPQEIGGIRIKRTTTEIEITDGIDAALITKLVSELRQQ